MTLFYWWMHWFWITTRIYLVLSINNTTQSINLHSILKDQTTPTILNILLTTTTSTTPNIATTTLATTGELLINSTINKYPPIILNPLNSWQNISKKKSSFKQPNYTTTINLFTTKMYSSLSSSSSSFNKETTSVINQNITTDYNITDNQLIYNNSINAINTDNTTYFDEDILVNESLILNYEPINIKTSDETNLSAAGITGITVGCIVFIGILFGISYFVYRNRGFNRPQVLNDRCSNPDSSGYIDDASVRDNSEEMYSLDNDSFLNSLEAMTIQNYWTDTVKHTKL